MPPLSPFPPALPLAVAPPSTSLGPFEDSAVAWAAWVTLMGFVGLTALLRLQGWGDGRTWGGRPEA